MGNAMKEWLDVSVVCPWSACSTRRGCLNRRGTISDPGVNIRPKCNTEKCDCGENIEKAYREKLAENGEEEKVEKVKETKNRKYAAKADRPLCSTGCGTPLRKDSVGGMCAKCRAKGNHGGAEKIRKPRKAKKYPEKIYTPKKAAKSGSDLSLACLVDELKEQIDTVRDSNKELLRELDQIELLVANIEAIGPVIPMSAITELAEA